MPGLVQDEITEINAAVDRRWRGIDPLLPEPGDLPEACRPNPLVAAGPGERGTGAGGALIRHVHDALDARGIDLTLLHHAQLNPLSAPFWHRMGYRPLWTTWEARPASTLR
jgi:GNAT superfamily N-acetyltransferase